MKGVSNMAKVAKNPIVNTANKTEGAHRLTLRIPYWLVDKIDIKRKERVGTISRTLFILEALDKATK